MTQKYVTALVVVGAGTSGCICAIAAARSGLKTILVEKIGMIGGVPVSAKVICKEKCNNHTMKLISLRNQLRSMRVVLEGGK